VASASVLTERNEQVDRRRVALLFAAQYLFASLLMFLPAGYLGWRKGWLFLVVNLALSAVIVPYIWRVNPGVLVARSRVRWAKRWAMILTSLIFIPAVAVIPVAAIEDGRFHWLPIPWWLCGFCKVVVQLGGLSTTGRPEPPIYSRWNRAVCRVQECPSTTLMIHFVSFMIFCS
jgi:hypothetical protein